MEHLIESYDFQLYESYIDILEERTELFNEIYVDAKKEVKLTKNSNKSAAAGVFKAYDGLTSVGAEAIKLRMNALKIITDSISNLAKFLAKIISIVSKNIIKFVNNLKRVPDKIKAKVSGNIELYITINDIPVLTNVITKEVSNFFNTLDKYISKKDTKYNINLLFMKGSVDISLINKLENSYNKLKNVRFEKTVIDLSNRVTANIYLNPDSSYYKGITETYQWLDNDKMSEQVKKYQINLSDKEDYNRMKDNYTKMSDEDRKRINSVASMISKILSVIANINRYMAHDINLINNMLVKASEHKLNALDKEFTGLSDKLNK